jgi:hypothetical protein
MQAGAERASRPPTLDTVLAQGFMRVLHVQVGMYALFVGELYAWFVVGKVPSTLAESVWPPDATANARCNWSNDQSVTCCFIRANDTIKSLLFCTVAASPHAFSAAATGQAACHSVHMLAGEIVGRGFTFSGYKI